MKQVFRNLQARAAFAKGLTNRATSLIYLVHEEIAISSRRVYSSLAAKGTRPNFLPRKNCLRYFVLSNTILHPRPDYPARGYTTPCTSRGHPISRFCNEKRFCVQLGEASPLPFRRIHRWKPPVTTANVVARRSRFSNTHTHIYIYLCV